MRFKMAFAAGRMTAVDEALEWDSVRRCEMDSISMKRMVGQGRMGQRIVL